MNKLGGHFGWKKYTVYSILYSVSVSHTPNQAELRTLRNVERGAQPQVQHFQCSQRGLVWVWDTDIIPQPVFSIHLCHCAILDSYLQQPHQHHVFRALFYADPHSQAKATTEERLSFPISRDRLTASGVTDITKLPYGHILDIGQWWSG